MSDPLSASALQPPRVVLYTYRWAATSNSTTFIKFADYTVVVCLTSVNNKIAYLEED